jgi:hypothetical protein
MGRHGQGAVMDLPGSGRGGGLRSLGDFHRQGRERGCKGQTPQAEGGKDGM